MKSQMASWLRRVDRQGLLFSFRGRATRSEFILFALISAICLVISILPGPDGFSVLPALMSCGIFLAAAARRLHDSGKSAWTLLALGVPYIGLGFVLWSVFAWPDESGNAYGPNPRDKAEFL